MTDTPRWMDAEAAARHLGLRLTTFLARVKAKTLPAPSLALGPRSARWDRDALDELLGAAAASNDERQAVTAAVASILAEGRKKGRPGRSQDAGGRLGRRIQISPAPARQA